MKKTVFLLVVSIILMSCNEQAGDYNEDYRSNNDITSEITGITASGDGLEKNVDQISQQSNNRKLIWSADMRFQVKNVDHSTEIIQTICSDNNGFISNMHFASNSYELANTIEIRVDNSKFHKLISSLKKEATFIDNVSINSDDVTEEYVDNESRLKTKKEVRNRYIEVLRNKAGTVKDIIAAEEATRVITEEIEVIEGRMRYLNDRIDNSTISLTIYEKVEYQDKPSIYEKPYTAELAQGFSNGWSVITDFILMLVTLWPIVVLSILFLWKRKWLFGLFFQKQKTE